MRSIAVSPAVLAGSLVFSVIAGCSGASGEDAEPTLEEVRSVTERFRDIDVALAEGYILDPMKTCDTAEMLGQHAGMGVMGVHYFRPDLLGITEPPNPRVNGTGTHTDFRNPGVLIYEPRPDGSLELVAVENLTFVAAWEAAGYMEPPSYQGVPYDLMQDDPSTPADEAHLFEPHYDRHVWVHKANPNGMFAQYNPNVSCEHHGDGTQYPAGAFGGDAAADVG